MATSFNRKEINAQKLACRVSKGPITIASGAGNIINHYALDPSRNTAIGLSHNASDAPTVEVTFTLEAHDDLEDSSVLWFVVYDGSSTPYIAGDSRGPTGMRIKANTPTNGAIKYEITQFGRRN